MTVDISEFRLPDDAFWQSGADHGRDPLVRKYKTEYFGVLVDAPREIALPGHKKLPLISYYMGSYQQIVTRSFADHAVIAVMDPDRNELYLADAEEDDGERVQVPNTTKAEDLPQGWLANIKELDVRERTRVPWRTGRLISQIVLLDLPSNRVETKIGSASSFVDPAKEKFLAEERGRQNPPAPFPKLPDSAYAQQAGSLPIPESNGIVLQADRVVVAEDKKPILLQGAFRLSVLPEEQVKADAAAYNKEHSLTGYAACLTIHLLVVGTGQRAPFQYRLQIPVKTVTEGIASGNFALDLTTLPDFPISEQTLFLYAYAKESATEPVTIGVIDRRTAE